MATQMRQLFIERRQGSGEYIFPLAKGDKRGRLFETTPFSSPPWFEGKHGGPFLGKARLNYYIRRVGSNGSLNGKPRATTEQLFRECS